MYKCKELISEKRNVLERVGVKNVMTQRTHCPKLGRIGVKTTYSCTGESIGERTCGVKKNILI